MPYVNMNYYEEIKNKLINDEIYSKVKDYSKEKHSILKQVNYCLKHGVNMENLLLKNILKS